MFASVTSLRFSCKTSYCCSITRYFIFNWSFVNSSLFFCFKSVFTFLSSLHFKALSFSQPCIDEISYLIALHINYGCWNLTYKNDVFLFELHHLPSLPSSQSDSCQHCKGLCSVILVVKLSLCFMSFKICILS